MAGKQIYTGKMMEDLISNIVTMTAKMTENVNILTSISLNTAQSVNALKIKASDNFKKTFFDTVRSTSPYANNSTVIEIAGGIKCIADGVVRVRITGVTLTQGNTASGNVSVIARVGATVHTFKSRTTIGTETVTASLDIPVQKGDLIELGGKVYNSNTQGVTSTISFPAGAVSIGYDLVNLVDDSPFMAV